MESLYNFDPNRNLGFDAGRALDFHRGRDLDFRSSRDLDFFANRDLGFGGRRVVFRETPRAAAIEALAKEAIRSGERAAPVGDRFCPYCSVPMRAGEECRNCHSRADGGVRIARMPATASKPVNREWRRAVER